MTCLGIVSKAKSWTEIQTLRLALDPLNTPLLRVKRVKTLDEIGFQFADFLLLSDGLLNMYANKEFLLFSCQQDGTACVSA